MEGNRSPLIPTNVYEYREYLLNEYPDDIIDLELSDE
jgi:hypothetical protein